MKQKPKSAAACATEICGVTWRKSSCQLSCELNYSGETLHCIFFFSCVCIKLDCGALMCV